MKYDGKKVILTIEEYDNLLQEVEYHKKTVDLFYKENKTLKSEFYPLADRIKSLEKTRNSILEEIKTKHNIIIESLQGMDDLIGAATHD